MKPKAAKQQRAIAVLLGFLALLASSATLPILIAQVSSPPLRVKAQLPYSTEGPHLALEPAPAPDTVDGIPVAQSGLATRDFRAGLHYIEWVKKYQGPHIQRVGAAQLVGPFIENSNPPCSTKLQIAPALFGEQESGKGIHAGLRNTITAEIENFSQWPIGDFSKLETFEIVLRRFDGAERKQQGPNDADDAESEKPAPQLPVPMVKDWLQRSASREISGYFQVRADIRFSKARLALSVFVVPEVIGADIKLHAYAQSSVRLDNRLYHWVAKRLDADRRIATLLQKEMRSQLRGLLLSPPEIPLEEATSIPLQFCKNAQLRFSELGHLEVDVAIGLAAGAFAPPQGKSTMRNARLPTPVTAFTPLQLGLDSNALNTLLHTLWARKILDRELGQAIRDSFNQHPTVRRFLDIRLGTLILPVPPTIFWDSNAQVFILRSIAETEILVGAKTELALLFTEIQIAKSEAKEEVISLQLSLAQSELTCKSDDGTLRPCYGHLVQQVRTHSAELETAMSRELEALVNRLLRSRTLPLDMDVGTLTLKELQLTIEDGYLLASLPLAALQAP